MEYNNSIKAFEKSQKFIPGGVNSPVRAFKSVGANPVFIKKAKGAHLEDVDGNKYIDFISSWGPLILGHANDKILSAINEAMINGTSFGAPTEVETEMAELICEMIPSVEKVRMVNSGTEATMSAIRLARGYTQKEKVIKFAGCYHGHGDSFLIKAGSGALTFGAPDSPGVTKGIAQDTLIADYNNIGSVETLFNENPNNIACVIIEPIAGNMGVVPPNEGFLQDLRQLCDNNNTLLIFDEVITGFRASQGGAQQLYNITPDLTTLGKIIGGGLPVGAYGGKAEIMDQLAPNGAIYQAGTLSGNPLAMAAGKAMLTELNNNPEIYSDIEKKASKLEAGIRQNIQKTGVNAILNRVGSVMTLFFTDRPQVTSFDDAMSSDTEKYAKYFRNMLEQGIYLAPAQFEGMFVSYAHTDDDIEKTIAANLNSLLQLT